MPSLFEEKGFKKRTANEKISFHQKELLENMKLVFKKNHYLLVNEGPITSAVKTQNT